ncbi:MAG: ABC transporter substrate-binding protein [Chloroflexi bacterium]|nr:MAG: ABC transporter substrate-binding protein [Phototrophicales bacterium]RMF80142.1 MAG: ABC transporter substrate-binding protein [Chloroflexota bacterium]
MARKYLFVTVLVALFAALAFGTVGAQDDEITIVFSHIFTDENRGGFIEQVAQDFMAANPGINVEIQTANSYRDNLNSALLAAQQGTAPHIVQIFEVGTQLALDSGIFVPVEEIATPEQLATLEDVITPVSNYYAVDDVQWSLPFNSSNPILYYNRDIFEAAGLDPDDPPETYGEVLEACETIMASQDLQGCIGWNMHGWFVEQWVAEQGALLANNDNGRADRATEVFLNSDAMLNVFNWWDTLADNGWYTYTGQLEDWNGSDAIFTGQQVAMHITSTADLVNINEAATNNGFELGTGFLPIPDDAERNGVVIGGASLWFTGGHPQEELEAAVEFALFLGNTQNGAAWHQASGYFPIRESAIEELNSAGWFDQNPAFRTAFDQLTQTTPNSATAGALIGNFLEVRTIVEEAAQAMVDGGRSPEDVLNEANERANAALAEFNATVAN